MKNSTIINLINILIQLLILELINFNFLQIFYFTICLYIPKYPLGLNWELNYIFLYGALLK